STEYEIDINTKKASASLNAPKENYTPNEPNGASTEYEIDIDTKKAT
ncbi:5496_t:CDS:2, partial [Ambispora leptoticha]